MTKTLLTTALTAGATLSALGFSKSEPALQHVSPVVAPTYLGLGCSQNTLQVSTSSSDAADLSPLVHTVTFEKGQLSSGFEALHADSSLSEVVSYYWETLSDLGFSGSVEALSGEAVNYSFSNGAERLRATFTQQTEGVSADLSGAELISTAY
jgi:hypothetical protein